MTKRFGKNMKVEFVELGEGLCGDYDPDDSEDVELLRFDVSYKNGKIWEAIDDASYCTRMPVDCPDNVKKMALDSLAAEYLNAIGDRYNPDNSPSVKKLGERMSWICPEDFTSK